MAKEKETVILSREFVQEYELENLKKVREKHRHNLTHGQRNVSKHTEDILEFLKEFDRIFISPENERKVSH